MSIAKQITTFLCDDVRNEVGNKVSLMGIYDEDIVFPSLPAMLPKLCLVVNMTDIKIKINTFKVKVSTPGNNPLEFTLPAPPNFDIHKNAKIVIALSPFKATNCGQASIEIIVDKEEKPFVIHKFSLKISEPSNQNA